MSHSKRLAVATTDRMISFYGLDGSTKKNTEPPKSRIEDLPAVPLCLEYVKHSHVGLDAKKNSDDKKPLETLLWGDDLGILTMYNFTETNWHICQYKNYKKADKNYLQCHKTEIQGHYNARQWRHEALKETFALNQQFDAKLKESSDAADNPGAAAASVTGVEGARSNDRAGKKVVDKTKSIIDKTNQNETEEEKAERKKQARIVAEKKRPVQYKAKEDGFKSIKVHSHWGWVTKIKYYEDLNMLLTSSLDGFIHMHELETLNYRQKRTFNLHLKGINSFVYSVKHK